MRKGIWATAILLLCLAFGACAAPAEEGTANIDYKTFESLDNEQKEAVFAELTGPQIYDLVKNSDESWPVTDYNLITPDNAKETIVLYDNHGDLHFNLDWPHFGGYEPESIASVGELSGSMDISRDGGDGGYCMTIGKNDDGSYPNNSQRSVPKTSASVNTGVIDIDRYKEVVDVVLNGKSKEERVSELCSMGYDEEIAKQLIQDQEAWLTRDEIAGPDNIADGAKRAGHEVDGKYGYCGITAPWVVDDLNLAGGAHQINPVFSWGTLRDSGLISQAGTAEIS